MAAGFPRYLENSRDVGFIEDAYDHTVRLAPERYTGDKFDLVANLISHNILNADLQSPTFTACCREGRSNYPKPQACRRARWQLHHRAPRYRRECEST